MFYLARTQQQPEWLDLGTGSLADVRTNLLEMWRINQTFAGVESLVRHLPVAHQRPICIVDLGTGSGKLAAYLTQRWAKQHQVAVQVYPIDVVARHITIAGENTQQQPNVQLIQADALALPFASGAIDYFVSSLFMHHFEPDELVNLLRNLYQKARHGIVMSDLVRGYAPLLGFKLIQPIFARHYLTHHDGLLSIKRAYTPSELLKLAQQADIPNARIHRYFPWRMTLVANKNDV